MEKLNFSDNVELSGRVLHLQTHTLTDKERIVSTLFDQGRVIDQRDKEINPAGSPESLRSMTENYHRARKGELSFINRVLPKVKLVRHVPSLLRLGRLLVKWHLLEDARIVIELAYDPLNPNTQMTLFLSEIHAKKNRHDNAIIIIRQAIEKNPNEADLWCELGWVFYRMPEKESAKNAVDKALAIHPDFAKAHFLRGIQLLREQTGEAPREDAAPKQKEMIDTLKKAVGLSPVYRLKAVAEAFKHSYSGDYQTALDLLEQVYDQTHLSQPDESDFFYLNFIYGESDDNDEAVRQFQARVQRMLEHDPQNPQRLCELGMTHLIQAHENLRKAMEAFAEAERVPESPNPLPVTKRELVLSYQKTGELLKQYFKKGG